MNGEHAPLSRPKLDRRTFTLGAIFLGTAAVTFARMPRQNIVAVPGRIDTILPARIGNWTGGPDTDFVMPPDDERKAAAIYDDQILSSYGNEVGERIMLVIAYARSQSSMLMVHRPESCYPGSGFTILSNEPTPIQLGNRLVVPGRFISASLVPRVEQVLYWTRLGDEFASSWDEERESLALQNLRGLVPDGALIRLSMIADDPTKARKTLEDFAQALFNACDARGKALLAGPSFSSA